MNTTIFNTSLVMGICAVANLSAKSLEGSRPNIIFILTDDQGMGDMSCMGNKFISTPNIDKFYAESTRFTEMHVSPTSAPSRAALMSGVHSFKNGVTHTILEREIMNISHITFPEQMQKAGYQTAIFGKWHLGDEDAYQPYNRGFNEVFIHGAGGIGQSFKNSSCADFPPNTIKEGMYFDNAILHNDQIVATDGFCTDLFFNAALGWIKKKIDKKVPYFAYIPLNAPHGPFIAPEKYRQKFLEAGWNDNTAGRYGMIENIDDNVGDFMAQLKKWDALENTLIIFMTDNGQGVSKGSRNGKRVALPRGGFKTGKNTPFEGGTHVPSFWYWKGVLSEGKDINALVAHIDFYKTFCELAGAKIAKKTQKLDGRSLLPLLENPNAKWEDRNLYIHVGRWKQGQNPEENKYKGCAVRTQKWRFVNNTLLYDIENDPYEKVNVYDKYPEVVAKLSKEYDAWWDEMKPYLINENRRYTGDAPQTIRYNKQLAEKGIAKWEYYTFE